MTTDNRPTIDRLRAALVDDHDDLVAAEVRRITNDRIAADAWRRLIAKSEQLHKHAHGLAPTVTKSTTRPIERRHVDELARLTEAVIVQVGVIAAANGNDDS